MSKDRLIDRYRRHRKHSILYLRLFCASVVAVLLLAMILILGSRRTVKVNLINELQDELRGTAIATQGSFDSMPGSFKRMESGKLIKGTTVVSGSYALIDKVYDGSGTYLGVFYGDELAVTSMRGGHKSRLQTATLPAEVTETVLRGGEPLFTENITVSSTSYYAYFLPMTDSDGSVVGVIMAAKELTVIQRKLNEATLSITIIAAIIVLIVLVVISWMDIKTMRSIQELFKDEEKVLELSRANEAKSEFLARMSHEIRTPINAVLGMDEMILRESRDASITGYAVNIRNSGQSLLSIINDILDFSKIESGKQEIVPGRYTLSSLLNDSYNMICARANEKNLKLTVINDPTIPSGLYGDELRIRQILSNLLTNAVKYTKEGAVTLCVNWQRLTEQKMLLKLDVKDTGIGIRKEDQQKLFNSFQRVDERQNRTIEGTGLGLAITRQLVDLMLGSVSVTSEYGVGSTFSVVIPQEISDASPLGDFARLHANVPESQDYKYREAFTAPDARILVVDDVLVNLNVIVGLLKNTRIQIDTVQSGMECLEAAVDVRYDMIFLDHMMPHMDGMETLERLKTMKDCVNLDTPVIALTANAIMGAREEYLSRGFTDYLPKPIQSNELEQMLMKYLPQDKVHLSSGTEAADGTGATAGKHDGEGTQADAGNLSAEHGGEGAPADAGKLSAEHGGEGAPADAGKLSAEHGGEGTLADAGKLSAERGGEGTPADAGNSSAERGGEGAPADAGNLSAEHGGEGAPADAGNSSAERGGEGAPADTGNLSAEHGGEGTPADAGNLSAEHGGEGAPTDTGNLSAERGGEGAPADAGNSSAERGGEGAPADAGNLSAEHGGEGAPADAGKLSAERGGQDKELLAALSFLDVNTGLSYCPGMAFYRSILNTFISDERREDLENFYINKAWDDYRILVHSIKSNALYIGATELSEEARAAEMAVKSGRMDELKNLHGPLSVHYDELLQKLIGLKEQGVL